MRKLIALPLYTGLFLLFLTMQLIVRAQQPVFIHLQSENKQAFQVKFDGNTYTSTSHGYLIVPKVNPGIKKLSIQFLSPTAVAYQFELLVQQKPQGYAIREGIDHQLSLFDLILMQTVSGTKPEIARIDPAPKPKQMDQKITIEKIYEKKGGNGIDQVYVIIREGRKETIALFIPDLAIVNAPPK